MRGRWDGSAGQGRDGMDWLGGGKLGWQGRGWAGRGQIGLVFAWDEQGWVGWEATGWKGVVELGRAGARTHTHTYGAGLAHTQRLHACEKTQPSACTCMDRVNPSACPWVDRAHTVPTQVWMRCAQVAVHRGQNRSLWLLGASGRPCPKQVAPAQSRSPLSKTGRPCPKLVAPAQSSCLVGRDAGGEAVVPAQSPNPALPVVRSKPQSLPCQLSAQSPNLCPASCPLKAPTPALPLVRSKPQPLPCQSSAQSPNLCPECKPKRAPAVQHPPPFPSPFFPSVSGVTDACAPCMW
eukprot:62269-Chlamydomonas_euryale.AAC.2